MTIKAIIFDVDGVITDTEPVHMEAWLSVLDPLGVSFEEDEYRKNYIGRNDKDFLDVLGHIHHRFFDDIERERLIEEKTKATLEILGKNIPLLDGVKEFVEEASKHFLLAICSGAQRSEIEFMLKKLKWTGIFNPVIASDSVKKGKPDPEGYVRAMEGLIERSKEVLLPENIMAIEDSPRGVAAAKAAGIKCFGVMNSFGADELKAADRVVRSIEEIDIKELATLCETKRSNPFISLFKKIFTL